LTIARFAAIAASEVENPRRFRNRIVCSPFSGDRHGRAQFVGQDRRPYLSSFLPQIDVRIGIWQSSTR
jgi:hypothetical protein